MDFGKSPLTAATMPSSSADFKNSRVDFAVVALSRSKIPIISSVGIEILFPKCRYMVSAALRAASGFILFQIRPCRGGDGVYFSHAGKVTKARLGNYVS